MQNYEYILIDSSKRSSNGTACDFSYELNQKPFLLNVHSYEYNFIFIPN